MRRSTRGRVRRDHRTVRPRADSASRRRASRSEEHTSELQSHSDLVCRLLLEKKKTMIIAPCLIILLLLPAKTLQFRLSLFYRRMAYQRQRTLSAVHQPEGATVLVGRQKTGPG